MWKRAWKDTISSFGWNKRTFFLPLLWLFGVFAYYKLEGWDAVKDEIIATISFALIPVALFLLLTFLFYLIRAPVYIRWEEEKKPRISVQTNTGRRQFDYENPHLMWATLSITNTSHIENLDNAEVQIATCLEIIEFTEDSTLKRHLYDRGTWNRISVLWSESEVHPPTTTIIIPPRGTRTALIGFQDNSNGMWTVFNSPTSPKPQCLWGNKIKIEISSNNSPLWEEEFYIECHGNHLIDTFPYQINAKFEFVEWNKWLNTHELTQPPTP